MLQWFEAYLRILLLPFLELPLTTALLLARYGFNKTFSESTAEIVHSESRQKVTKVGKSLIFDRDKSTSLVPNIRPFISVLGTVIPLRGATRALDRRRQGSKDSLHPRIEDHRPAMS